ncbi:MAG: AAA family ATPase [Microlunatus sp.]
MVIMGAGSQLVGREHAKAILAEALAQARTGIGRLITVTGEAGIGKSALLAWLAARAEPDALVLRASCWEGAGAPPYWPWTQMLQPWPSNLEPAPGAAALEAAGAGGAAAAADARFRLLESVARAFGELAERSTVVVVIDDLQWADDPSLELLDFLARAPVTRRVLFVAAYRDDETTSRFAGLVGATTQIPLFGLAEPDVARLVDALPGRPLPPEVVPDLWRRSGGNPFFVGELARLLQAQSAAAVVTMLPASVIETVRRRLARLSTGCVQLLDWAAAAGREIEPLLLVAAGAAADETAAADLLGVAGRAGIVTLGDPPYFTHDLYRDAILVGLPAQVRSEIHLRLGRALAGLGRPGTAGRVAAHLCRAGPSAREEAIGACLQAGHEASARLGHADAARHYEQALQLLTDHKDRAAVLLDLAAALDRAGRSDEAWEHLRIAAQLAQELGDPVLLARCVLGLHGLGARSGAQTAEIAGLLEDAERQLAAVEPTDDPVTGARDILVLRSRLLAASTRVARHGSRAAESPEQAGDLVATAERAVALATAAQDPAAVASARLAQHDVAWSPGSAQTRLPLVAAMQQAAEAAKDADLTAQGHLLRATALLELGDPAGLRELLTYVELAEALGHARGRWGALTRRATYAQIVGQLTEAVRLGEEALELGRAIGEPDAVGCFCTHRWSLVALGVGEPEMRMDATDPLWPIFPLIRAWGPAARGAADEARALLGDFSVRAITPTYDLERYAVAAVVFAAVGTDEQRRWAYDRLAPHAGRHVLVGGAAAYHAAVDHHLGSLAAALHQVTLAERHYQSALAQHRELGAAGWARTTEHALAALEPDRHPRQRFRLSEDGRWQLDYDGRTVTLPDAKGLRDLHTIIAAGGRDVHVLDLLDGDQTERRFGADPVLDDRARAEYRARVSALDAQIAEAESRGDADGSDRFRTERTAIITELAAATGLGGRSRRLGDVSERARKTVGARVRDSLLRLDRMHPGLATHLRTSVRMGTVCCYRPEHSVMWDL